ncbi:hypothetical protein QE152_g21793 [Popillia japonica]|uniref:Uncharacterized protein n=1 Tax=Popillia japonica TaxID=7064 RepID=A0AAW1KMC7_POPJA
MAQIAGTYQLVEAINPEEILKAAGQEVTPVSLAGVTDKSSKLTVTVDGDNYSFVTTIGDNAWRREIKFTIGKAFEEEFKGSKASTVATRVGDKFVFKSTTGANVAERTYEFAGTTVTMIYNPGSAVEAKRIYKRI